jgi:hypothetical protein
MSSAPRRKSGFLFFGIVLLAAGFFFLGALIWNQGRLAIFGKRADGVVREITETTRTSATTRRDGESLQAYRERSRRKGTRYTLRVQFTPEGGAPAEFSTTSTFGHTLEKGGMVRVIYLPGDPAGAEIDSARQLWLPMAVGFIVSAVCLGGGALLIRRT